MSQLERRRCSRAPRCSGPASPQLRCWPRAEVAARGSRRRPSGRERGTTSAGASGDAGITLAKANVPVGGGVVDGVVVVVQPTAGDFKAFSAVCTHQQCLVGAVTDGFIVCPCHDSHFAIADGAPTRRVDGEVAADPQDGRRQRRCPRRQLTVSQVCAQRPTSRVGGATYSRAVADPATYRPAAGSVPDAPGVYRFRDARGRVIYVGKAKSLRSRLASYFQDLAACTRAPRRWSRPRRRWTGPSSPPRSRRCSSSTPGSRSTTRASTSGTATTRATRASPSPSTRSTPGCR